MQLAAPLPVLLLILLALLLYSIFLLLLFDLSLQSFFLENLVLAEPVPYLSDMVVLLRVNGK